MSNETWRKVFPRGMPKSEQVSQLYQVDSFYKKAFFYRNKPDYSIDEVPRSNDVEFNSLQYSFYKPRFYIQYRYEEDTYPKENRNKPEFLDKIFEIVEKYSLPVSLRSKDYYFDKKICLVFDLLIKDRRSVSGRIDNYVYPSLYGDSIFKLPSKLRKKEEIQKFVLKNYKEYELCIFNTWFESISNVVYGASSSKFRYGRDFSKDILSYFDYCYENDINSVFRVMWDPSYKLGDWVGDVYFYDCQIFEEHDLAYIGDYSIFGGIFEEDIDFPKNCFTLSDYFEENGISKYLLRGSNVDFSVLGNRFYVFKVCSEHIASFFKLPVGEKISKRLSAYIKYKERKAEILKLINESLKIGFYVVEYRIDNKLSDGMELEFYYRIKKDVRELEYHLFITSSFEYKYFFNEYENSILIDSKELDFEELEEKYLTVEEKEKFKEEESEIKGLRLEGEIELDFVEKIKLRSI